MLRYLDAIEPLVIFCSRPLAFPRPSVVGFFAADLDNSFKRGRGACVVLGVIRPRCEGVTRPLDGVIRPPRDEATEDGRLLPTVGADSFVVETKTPHFGGQVKYCLLRENISVRY